MLRSRGAALGITRKEDMDRIRNLSHETQECYVEDHLAHQCTYGNRGREVDLPVSWPNLSVAAWHYGYHSQEIPPVLCQLPEGDLAGGNPHPAPSCQLLFCSQHHPIACGSKVSGPEFPDPGEAKTPGQPS